MHEPTCREPKKERTRFIFSLFEYFAVNQPLKPWFFRRLRRIMLYKSLWKELTLIIALTTDSFTEFMMPEPIS